LIITKRAFNTFRIKGSYKVLTTGFEPARPKRTPAPQAGVSTNFTT
jgi:hypothetical protein